MAFALPAEPDARERLSCSEFFKMSSKADVELVEGEDYYFEDGLMVLTARYLGRRGYCCDNGCRHCPYRESDDVVNEDQA